jgi:hypothetical protein
VINWKTGKSQCLLNLLPFSLPKDEKTTKTRYQCGFHIRFSEEGGIAFGDP